MNWVREHFFSEIYYDEKAELQVRALKLIGFYTWIAVVLTVPCFLLAGYDTAAYVVSGASFIMLFLCFGLFLYSKDTALSSIVFCYIVNLVIIPLFFIYAGGVYGGMEFFMLCGMMDGVLLLSGTVRILSELVYFSWYTSIIMYSSLHPEVIHNIPSAGVAIFSLCMCIIVSSVIFLVLTDYEGYLLKAKQEGVKETVRQRMMSAETKSRFLSNVSHELRTPMNAIIGMSGIIQNSDVDGKLTEEISIITHNARDLLSTINSILDYSRLESGKLSLSFDQFEFGIMMREIVQEASIRAEEKGIDFFVDIDPDTPNILYGDYIQLEMILQDLIHDAIDSVTDGRVHFRIRGRYSKDMSKAVFTAEISDTGEGISDEDLNSIYSSFETYDSRQDSRIKRLGLKYSVFRGILKLMNGDFSIKSLKDVGTSLRVSFEVFTVERIVLADKSFTTGKKALLYAYGEKGSSYMDEVFDSFGVILETAYMPDAFAKMYGESDYRYIFVSENGYADIADIIKDEDREKVFVITDRMGTPADFDGLRIIRRPLNTLNLSDIFFERWEDMDYMDYMGVRSVEGFVASDAKILVVDDNRVNLRVAESMLQKYKARVKITESGYSAMDMMKSESFDLVLMDQVMPGMDGFEVMKLIRSSLVIRGARRIPIVCMTAESGSDIREKVMKAGFSDYLSKPVKESELERVLITHLPDDKIETAVPNAG